MIRGERVRIHTVRKTRRKWIGHSPSPEWTLFDLSLSLSVCLSLSLDVSRCLSLLSTVLSIFIFLSLRLFSVCLFFSSRFSDLSDLG